MEGFLENQRQQPTFLWETATLKTNKHTALSYALRVIYRLGQCGGRQTRKSLYGQGHCLETLGWLITVYTQRSFLILQCHISQLFFVCWLLSFYYSSFSVLYCSALYTSVHCVCRWWFSSQKRYWAKMADLFISYLSCCELVLFPAWLAFPPSQCNMQCNLCYILLVLNGSCLTAHTDILFIYYIFSNKNDFFSWQETGYKHAQHLGL